MLTILQLHDTFKRLQASVVDGVSGVIRIESSNPGPVLGITACTHGNEPSGLAIFDYLLNSLNIEHTLTRGTLYLVLNNIKATETFFNAKTNDEIRKARYCDVNMNRLPKDVLNLVGDIRYEVQRTQEVYSILSKLQYGLDVHSTLESSEPMIISRGGEFHDDLVHGFPMEKLISNIDKVQLGVPVIAFFGGLESQAKVFAIEAGQHTEPDSFMRAATCAASLLENLSMLPMTHHRTAMQYEEYRIDDSIVFPDISFDFIKQFKSFDQIREGDVLATNQEGEKIRAPFDGHLIMPSMLRGKEKYMSEEAAFISRPVRIRRVG